MHHFPWLLIYISSVLILFSALDRRYRVVFAFVLLGLFSAIRYKVGWDYDAYALYSMDHYLISDGYNPLIFEPLNYLIIYIGSLFEISYFYLPVSALLTQFFFMLSILKNNFLDEKIFILFYLVFPWMYLATLNNVRQMLAVSLLFYAYSVLSHRSNTRILYGILAAFIHMPSLLIFLVMEFFKRQYFQRFWYFGILSIVLIFSFIDMDSIYKYEVMDMKNYGENIYLSLMLIIIFLLFFKRFIARGLKNNAQEIMFFIALTTFTLVYLIASYNSPAIFGRVLFFFTPFIFAYFSYLFFYMSKDTKILAYLTVIFLTAFMLYYQLKASDQNTKHQYLTYQTIFSIEE